MATTKATTKKATQKEVLDVTVHTLVPTMEKLSKEEQELLFARYKIESDDLPKVKLNDPGVHHLGLQEGDVVKITRKSLTAGETVYFRKIVHI